MNSAGFSVGAVRKKAAERGRTLRNLLLTWRWNNLTNSARDHLVRKLKNAYWEYVDCCRTLKRFLKTPKNAQNAKSTAFLMKPFWRRPLKIRSFRKQVNAICVSSKTVFLDFFGRKALASERRNEECKAISPISAKQERREGCCSNEEEAVSFIKQINKRDGFVRPLALRAFGNVERLKVAACGFRGDVIFGGKGGELEIKKGDLKNLLENAWLGDDVINGFLRLLQARANAFASSELGLKVQFLSTFLFTKLTDVPQLGCPTGFNIQGVRRWTRNVNLFDQDLVLLPVNLHAAKHWVLVAVYMKERRIEYYDSLPRHVEASYVDYVLTVVERYMHAMAEAENNIEFATAAWKKHQMVEGVPVQDDKTACGVFLCTFADLLARGLRPPFQFSAADVEGLRNGIALCLMNGVLPYTPSQT